MGWPNLSARALSFSVSSARVKVVFLADLGAGFDAGFDAGFSTRGILKRAARAFRFSRSSLPSAGGWVVGCGAAAEDAGFALGGLAGFVVVVVGSGVGEAGTAVGSGSGTRGVESPDWE